MAAIFRLYHCVTFSSAHGPGRCYLAGGGGEEGEEGKEEAADGKYSEPPSWFLEAFQELGRRAGGPLGPQGLLSGWKLDVEPSTPGRH